MKVTQNRLERVFILFREYISYLAVNPRLIFVIPKRLWEEFYLHIQYFFVRITGTSKNKALRLQLQTLRTDMENVDLMYRPSLLWEDLYNQFERVLHVEDMSNFKTQRYNRRFSAYSPQIQFFMK